MCRLCAGNHDDTTAMDEWISTRKAEGLGDKPMIGINHTDTIFAPVFAEIYPNSRFVYLRRNPEDVFQSFVTKNQWGSGANVFRPVLYNLEGVYQFNLPQISEADGVRWHLEFTEGFSRNFGKTMGDRFIEISSDKLFAQDEAEINRLLEFTGSDIKLDEAKEHFTQKINEKRHKINHTEMIDDCFP